MRTYGDPQALVTFYVKHGCLDKACQLVVEYDLGDTVRHAAALLAGGESSRANL